MTFAECCVHCIGNQDLVKEFNRLSGLKLGMRRAPIERLIDETCGYDPDKEAFPLSCRFVYEFIWLPIRKE